MAVPGLIDCHNHVVLMGNRPGHHTPLENAYSLPTSRPSTPPARRACRRPNPPVSADGFITTIGGFSPNQFKEVRLPTLAELDAAVPDNPVLHLGRLLGAVRDQHPRQGFFRERATARRTGPVGADGSIAAAPFLATGRPVRRRSRCGTP